METKMITYRLSRRELLGHAVLASTGALLPGLSAAQPQFPQRSVKLICGLPPGGAADVIVRAFGAGLEADAKVPFIVDNRPGGQFAISVNALNADPADGHTLLYIYSGYAAIQATQGLFNLTQGMVPVARVATSPVLLMTRGDAPYKTVAEMVAWAKANPKKLNWGTFGEASLEHLKLAQIEKAAGFKAAPIPYKGGPDLVKALLGGEVDCALAAGLFGKMYAPTGKLQVLAVLEPKRWDAFPNVPTIREAGINTDPLTYWGGFIAKKGTPPETVERLAKMIGRAAHRPDVISRVEASGQAIDLDDQPESFKRLIESDVAWMSAAYKLL